MAQTDNEIVESFFNSHKGWFGVSELSRILNEKKIKISQQPIDKHVKTLLKAKRLIKRTDSLGSVLVRRSKLW